MHTLEKTRAQKETAVSDAWANAVNDLASKFGSLEEAEKRLLGYALRLAAEEIEPFTPCC